MLARGYTLIMAFLCRSLDCQGLGLVTADHPVFRDMNRVHGRVGCELSLGACIVVRHGRVREIFVLLYTVS